jgi:hypothetical protein
MLKIVAKAVLTIRQTRQSAYEKEGADEGKTMTVMGLHRQKVRIKG